MKTSSTYVRGNSLPVDRKLFGANRQNLISSLQKKHKSGLVLLKGGTAEAVKFYDTDGESVFRQEGFFHWAFGAEAEDCLGVIDVERSESALFVPKLPEEFAVWMGKIESLQEIKTRYAVDHTAYIEDLEAFVRARNPSMLHVLSGVNTDSGHQAHTFDIPAGLQSIPVDKETLFSVMTALRRVKSKEEIEVMRYASLACSKAHVEVMKAVRPGWFEFQAESLFKHVGYSSWGCRHTAYTSICASGPNPAVLHYGHHQAPNDRLMQAGDMLLIDAGLEYYRYASDITCTYPVNGKFTPEQKVIYEAVLDAHQTVIDTVKPGTNWVDMHTLANEIILTHLLRAGLVHAPGGVKELIENDIGGVFFPHGLGHFLGISTHDVGGYQDAPPRIMRPGYKSLRTTRNLEVGNVITVEPGCYFNEYLLTKAKSDESKAKYLDFDVISKYVPVGGVRIEDNIVITERGCESLTKVPRTVSDIEAVMAGKLEWKFE